MVTWHVDASVVIILSKSGEVFLQKKTADYKWFPGKWCLFGGGVEAGEDSETTVREEIKEELEYDMTNLKFIKETSYKDVCGEDTREGKQYIYVHEIELETTEFWAKVSLHEGADMAFFSELELSSDLVVDHDLRSIKEYLSKRR